ncbi:TonB-dependent receptor [Sphingomonas sp. MS122]|uniref:TonB-dependent receptor n=1 Tax=Sphingomonas sp. MS122 TaxID=3412683 RepID=UPI003C2D8E1B
MRGVAWAMTGLMVTAAPTAMAAAQQAPAPAPAATAQEETPATPASGGDAGEELEGEEVVVTGQLRGAVPGDVKPEVMLGAADIRAYGASNISELIEQLAPQLGSSAGRGGEQPVILLSGRRSSLQEVARLPSEAIERVDILPEEAALRYGYSATQKVLNIVLRPRFQAVTAEIQGRVPTAGGNAQTEADLNITKITRDGRIEFDMQLDTRSGILESERGVTRAPTRLFDTRGNITGITGGEIDPALSAAAGTIVTVAGVPDAAAGGPQGLGAFAANANSANVTDLSPYRTLINPQRNIEIGGRYSRTLSPTVRATANVQLTARQSEALLGLPTATLRLPAGNPFSPFSQDVQVLRYLNELAPLSRLEDGQTLQTGFTINGDQSPWSAKWGWSVTGGYDRSWSDTVTSTGVSVDAAQGALNAGDPSFNPFAPIPLRLLSVRPSDTASSQSSLARIDALTNGPLFKLPAGDVTTSIRIAGTTRDLSSQSFRSGVFRETEISRDTASVRGNINLPIASRNRAVLSAIGDLSIFANAEVEEVSDFGRLTTTGYGLNWRPLTQVTFIANWTNDSNAPSPEQLGDPVISTPNVAVFDYVRGESVDVTRITGGNPLLRADRRNVMRLGTYIRPFAETDLTIRANYTEQTYRSRAQSFPALTAEVQAAFPGRFVRDGEGRLLSVDARPINSGRGEQRSLNWGISLGLPLPSPNAKRRQAEMARFREAMAESRRTGEPLPPEFSARMEEFRRLRQQESVFGGSQRGPGGQDGQQVRRQGQEQGPPPGADMGQRAVRFGGPGGPGGGGRGGFGGRRGGGGNQLRFDIQHDWLIEDQSEIAPGIVISRLTGDSGDPTPAHRVRGSVNVRYDWLRANLRGTWASGSRTSSGLAGNATVLDFGSLTTFNFEAGVRPAEYMDAGLKHPWLRGVQVELQVINIFDSRQRVVDQNGVTPAAYLPNLRDRTGRVVQLSLRKQLF